VRTEPTAAEVGFLLEEIDASTRRVAASLGAVDLDMLLAPSLLPGWARATIAAHLTWVADRYVAMTADALAGRATTTYPGGPAQRDASLRALEDATAEQALIRFEAASAALADAWRHLGDRQWATTMHERHIGPMRLSRLTALRLTELEVHHVDLDVGYRVTDWPAAFTRICLPLRIAWLDAHHRRRHDTARQVAGRWLLAPTDDSVTWLVTAWADQVTSQPAPADAEADVTLSGPSASLLAFLLGRQPDPPLAVYGDPCGRFTARARNRIFLMPNGSGCSPPASPIAASARCSSSATTPAGRRSAGWCTRPRAGSSRPKG